MSSDKPTEPAKEDRTGAVFPPDANAERAKHEQFMAELRADPAFRLVERSGKGFVVDGFPAGMPKPTAC